MPANTSKAHDDCTFVTVRQDADGHISGLELTDELPFEEDVWRPGPNATVWALPDPDNWTGEPTDAVKILDLGIDSNYRFAKGSEWADGEHAFHAFHSDPAGHRTFLRTVESHMIRAGYFDAHTCTVAGRTFGLAFDDAADNSIYKTPAGWAFMIQCNFDLQPDIEDAIAPVDASPRRVALAALIRLAGRDLVEYDMLTPAYRLAVRYGLWRIRPRTSRRGRITVRVRTR
ncbi:hypothetical protein [Streptomyces sp. NPDC097619]|uniref:hypothetical protein n=1 Tax=Streptomyces sp. NPDC097619 TaxID=3157228 RepID=UPI003334A340